MKKLKHQKVLAQVALVYCSYSSHFPAFHVRKEVRELAFFRNWCLCGVVRLDQYICNVNLSGVQVMHFF